MLKICNKCNKSKSHEEFTYGYATCKKCRAEVAKVNRASTKEYRKDYYKKNKDTIKEKHGEYFKSYQKEHKEKIYNKRKLDTFNRVKQSIRNGLNKTLNKYEKDRYENLLGCSYNDLKIYLENKFEEWMDWDNYGKYNGNFKYGWDIDHIIPLSYATTEEELIKLKHYTNLQPLDSKINRHIKRSLQNYDSDSDIPNKSC